MDWFNKTFSFVYNLIIIIVIVTIIIIQPSTKNNKIAVKVTSKISVCNKSKVIRYNVIKSHGKSIHYRYIF